VQPEHSARLRCLSKDVTAHGDNSHVVLIPCNTQSCPLHFTSLLFPWRLPVRLACVQGKERKH